MKPPLYNTFLEFEKNYQNDLKEWLEENPKGQEIDYLNTLLSFNYKIYLKKDYEFMVLERKHGAFVEVSYSFHNIKAIFKAQFTEYVGAISRAQSYYNKKFQKEIVWDFISRGVLGNHKLIFSKMSSEDFMLLKTRFMTYSHSVNREIKFTGISKIIFRDYCFLEEGQIKIDWKSFFEKEYIEKYKIAQWIMQKLNPDDTTNEIPESDYSENEDKEKLIILEKLKIIDYIKSIQTKPETISHTAEIISAFTGINSGTLYSYLRPVLSANRDDSDKNSPYKNPENVLSANKTIHKLKIKTDDKN